MSKLIPTAWLPALLASLTLALPSANALEQLNDDSMGVVAAEGIGHLLSQTSAPTNSQDEADAPHSTHHRAPNQVGKYPSPTHTQSLGSEPNAESTQSNISRSLNTPDAPDNNREVRTNQLSDERYADLSVQFDRTKNANTSSGSGDRINLNIANQIDSAAAVDVRHQLDDTATRGSFYLNNIQMNTFVTIDGR